MEMSKELRSGDAWREGCVHATQEIIAAEFDLVPDAIMADGRCRSNVSLARQTAMYLCHVVCSIPISQVAKAFNRDRTTVAYACRKIEDMRDRGEFESFISKVEMRLKKRMDALEFQHLIETKSTYVCSETKALPRERYIQGGDNVMYVRFGSG